VQHLTISRWERKEKEKGELIEPERNVNACEALTDRKTGEHQRWKKEGEK